MKKILIVDPNSSGGHNTYCHSLSKVLAQNGNEVAYLNAQCEKIENGYTHELINISENGLFNKVKKYYSFFKKINFFYSNGYRIHFQVLNYQMMFVLMFLIIKSNITITYTLHNLIPHSFNVKEKIKYKLLHFFLQKKCVDKIFYHYEYLKNVDNDIIDKMPIRIKNKMVFVPHHLFENNIKINSKTFDNNKIEILIFGVIRDNKGVIEFFRKIKKENINLKKLNFVIAGKFIDYTEDDLLKEINHLTNLNIQIINKFISEDEKEKLFSNCDYILLPYKKTFLAQSGLVLDAYQYQKPLIVSSNISLKYLVQTENTGLFYKDDNFKNIFENIVPSKTTYDTLCRNISNVIKNKYNNKSIASLYEKLVG